MRDTQLTVFFWMLLFIAPTPSVAGTQVADIGLQQPEKSYGSEPAAPVPADSEDEDC
jgi:hypothetical protein